MASSKEVLSRRSLIVFTFSILCIGGPLFAWPPKVKWPSVNDAKRELSNIDPFKRGSVTNDFLNRADPSRALHRETRITGKHLGTGFGEGIKPSLDMVVENMSSKMSENIDHLGKTLQDTTSEASRIFNRDLEAAGGRLIDKLDVQATKIIEHAVTQLDELSKSTIQEAEASANRVLDDKLEKVDRLAQTVLDREAKILDESLSRIESLADTSLDRIEKLQVDSFDRIDAALQDQVPFATSEIANQVVLAGLALVLISVLGVSCYSRAKMRNILDSDVSFRERIKAAFDVGLRALVSPGIPALVVGIVVYGAYCGFCAQKNRSRLASLAAVAVSLENSGNFSNAAAFRQRIARLSPSENSYYFVERNQFLSKYYEGHRRLSGSEILAELSALYSTKSRQDLAVKDAEIVCLRAYLASGYASYNVSTDLKNSKDSFIRFLIPERVDLDSTFLMDSDDFAIGDSEPIAAAANLLEMLENKLVSWNSKGKKLPYSGKLVFVGRIRNQLNKRGTEVKPRLVQAEETCTKMVECYPEYPAGLIAAANISETLRTGLRLARNEDREILEFYATALGDESDQAKRLDTARALMVADLEASDFAFSVASHEDLRLATLVRNSQAALPKEELSAVETLASVDADEAKKSKANELLVQWIMERDTDASTIYGFEPLRKAYVNQMFRAALTRALLWKELVKEIKTARADLDGALVTEDFVWNNFQRCITICKLAVRVDRLDIAEYWLKSAEEWKSQKPSYDWKAKEPEYAPALEAVRNATNGPILARMFPEIS